MKLHTLANGWRFIKVVLLMIMKYPFAAHISHLMDYPHLLKGKFINLKYIPHPIIFFEVL